MVELKEKTVEELRKMASKKKTNCHGWGIFGGKHKKNKSCATGIFRTPAQKRASSKRKKK